ncbi:MAG: hypothetical protein AAGA87_00080 [Pseudomonadota bacterium]
MVEDQERTQLEQKVEELYKNGTEWQRAAIQLTALAGERDERLLSFFAKLVGEKPTERPDPNFFGKNLSQVMHSVIGEEAVWWAEAFRLAEDARDQILLSKLDEAATMRLGW